MPKILYRSLAVAASRESVGRDWSRAVTPGGGVETLDATLASADSDRDYAWFAIRMACRRQRRDWRQSYDEMMEYKTHLKGVSNTTKGTKTHGRHPRAAPAPTKPATTLHDDERRDGECKAVE